MANQYNKLELRWHGKDTWEAPEQRLLVEKDRFKGKKGIDDNLLIYGDNLLGLKALERDYTDKVKCIYIDPPYNTKSCFGYYDDNMEHSLWLNMMKERLLVLYKLLSEDGSIWISIDDCESHYLKVLCDEVFGRKNFVINIVWNHSVQVKGYKNIFSLSHNYVLVYQKSSRFNLKSAPRTNEDNKQYRNPDNDPKGPWCRGPVANSLYRKNLIYPILSPNGTTIQPPEKGWRWSKDTLQKKIDTGEVLFNETQTGIFRKIYLSDQEGKSPSSLWLPEDVGTTREAAAEVRNLDSKNIFPTPKPERLIQRIIHHATNPKDIVLDCFAGSGTTGAVAHKMGRRWIMIELGEHCHTHIIPRMTKVIDGEDSCGVTEQVGWKGGGGFKYCELAPSLLEKNKLGRWTLNKDYNPALLTEAVCLHAGYQYAPKRNPYWIHGFSTERDFIYVTARTLTTFELARLSAEVGEDSSLMVYCEAYKCDEEFENLTIEKIPKAILKKCTWGKDDYSLKMALKEEVDKANRKINSLEKSFNYSKAPMVASGRRK